MIIAQANLYSLQMRLIPREVFSGTAGNVEFGAPTGTSLNTHTIPSGTGTLALTSDIRNCTLVHKHYRLAVVH